MLGQRGEDARHMRREGEPLGRRLRGRDEPARDEAVEAHARREHRRVAQLRLVAEDVALDAVGVALEARDLRLEQLPYLGKRQTDRQTHSHTQTARLSAAKGLARARARARRAGSVGGRRLCGRSVRSVL
eukprot:280540-Prymnesium_polylepis.1